METLSSPHTPLNRPSSVHSVFKTVAAVLAALVTWIVVATVLNLPLRASWQGYHEAETAFTFSFGMKLARLSLGAISSLAAGFVAGWVETGQRRAATVTGLMLLGLFVPNHYLLWNKFPVWYHLTFLLSLVPLTLLGANIRHRRPERET
jgi:hypothetical protein